MCNNRCLGWGRAMLGSTMDTCYASSRVAFGRIYDFLHEGVDSAPELDSRPALLPPVAGTSSTTAVACSILVLLVLTHLALCSHDCRQSGEKYSRCFGCSRDALGNLNIISPSLLYLSACSAFEFLRESIFWRPRALTPVSARGLEGYQSWGALDDEEFFVVEGSGYRSRRESRLPGDSVPVLHN